MEHRTSNFAILKLRTKGKKKLHEMHEVVNTNEFITKHFKQLTVYTSIQTIVTVCTPTIPLLLFLFLHLLLLASACVSSIPFPSACPLHPTSVSHHHKINFGVNVKQIVIGTFSSTVFLIGCRFCLSLSSRWGCHSSAIQPPLLRRQTKPDTRLPKSPAGGKGR